MSNPVEELLKSKGIYYTNSGKDFLIKCLNPSHTDTNPSFRVDKITGISHCFSCGHKCNIFRHFGVLTNNVSIRIAKLKDKLLSLKQSIDGLEPLKGARPVSVSYRGISNVTLKLFGAFSTDLVEEMVDRICFPITDIRDKVVAYVGRNTLTDAGQRYANYPSGASLPLFPAKLENYPSTMILVEGLFDLLNCYDKGIHNVVCTFGTQKLNKDTGSKLFPYKVMGVEKIYILFDGDEAGRSSANHIKPLIEEAGFMVEIIKLPEGMDPGGLDQEYIDSIKEYTKQ